MKKYNLSIIMKRAWSIVKKAQEIMVTNEYVCGAMNNEYVGR